MKTVWIAAWAAIVLLLAFFSVLTVRCGLRCRAGSREDPKRLPYFILAIFILLVVAAMMWVGNMVWAAVGSR